MKNKALRIPSETDEALFARVSYLVGCLIFAADEARALGFKGAAMFIEEGARGIMPEILSTPRPSK